MSWISAGLGPFLDDLDLSRGQQGLLAAAIVTTAVWLLALSALRVLRRPRTPPDATPTLELGPEPPALANMLASGFKVTEDAVPATLLDLAARRVVEIERVDVGSYQCRLRQTAAGATPYEGRVLDLLRKQARDGVVPAQALTTGPAEESARWWKAFTREVVADAQQRGLSRDLWSREVLVALGAVAALPAVLVGIAFGWQATAGYAIAAGLLLSGIHSRRRQRDTHEGLAAASRWTAVRDGLEEDEEFSSQPPTAIVLWERLLAYGAALGVAAGAVRAIPMGAESDTRAWSSYGGRWHQVRISYPSVYPLGWGRQPLAALLLAALFGGIAIFVLYVIRSVASSADAVDGLGTPVLAAIVAVPALVLLAAAAVAVRAVLDLWDETEVTGELVRLRAFESKNEVRHYVAVDDGTRSSIRAWRIRPELVAGLAQYQVVTVRVTRRLGYVRSLARAGPSP